MSGKPSRDKGQRFERDVSAALNEHPKLWAQKVPESGAAGGMFAGDIHLRSHAGTGTFPIEPLVIECKARKSGFKFLYDNLKGVGALVVKQDRQQPLIVMPLSEWIKQVGGE